MAAFAKSWPRASRSGSGPLPEVLRPKNSTLRSCRTAHNVRKKPVTAFQRDLWACCRPGRNRHHREAVEDAVVSGLPPHEIVAVIVLALLIALLIWLLVWISRNGN